MTDPAATPARRRHDAIVRLVNVEGFTLSEATAIVDETIRAGFLVVDDRQPVSS